MKGMKGIKAMKSTKSVTEITMKIARIQGKKIMTRVKACKRVRKYDNDIYNIYNNFL